ncbi:MAG: methionine synthase [Actinobacteria bacterium]|nr:methionine synthase [Actinomycetota bacterium]
MPIDLSELSAAGPVLTDGAMGTQLDALGLPAGTPPELWNLDNPQAVGSVHSAYAQAGSEVVLTNTFQANSIVLARHGLDKRTADLNKAAVEISAEAVGMDALVFGSVGPTGKMLITGEVTETELTRAFAQQITALARAGAAAIVLETFADPAEARCALKAAADSCDLPVVVSFSFAAGSDNDRTVMGADAARIVDELAPLSPDAFGANCGVGPDIAVSLVKRYRRSWDGPVWIKPNAGLPQLIEGKTVFSASPQDFASYVPALVRAGADFIGGCCGSTPEHIRAAAEML